MPEGDGSWQQRQNARRRYKLKTLPHVLDTAALANTAPDVPRDKGMGRVVQDMMEATQANFDHLSAEMSRFANMFNEGAADTEYLKEQLESIPRASAAPTTDMGNGTPNDNAQAYIQTFHLGAEIDVVVDDDEIWVVPIWVGQSAHFDQLSFLVTFAASDAAASMRFGIYNGDGPGGLPSTLVEDFGVVDTLTSTQDYTVDISVDLTGGQWYWIACAQENETGDAATLLGYGTGGESITIGGWWPFPRPQSHVTSINGYSYAHTTGALEETLSQAVVDSVGDVPDFELRTGAL